MITKTVRGSLEVKEVINDESRIVELERARIEVSGNVGIGTATPCHHADPKPSQE